MPSPDALLKEALSLTQEMHELGKRDEWEEVQVLETRQSALLRECFEPGHSFQSRAKASELLQQILDLNKEILEVGGSSKCRLKENISKIQKGREATRAYLSHSE